jgi:hypothetical protein
MQTMQDFLTSAMYLVQTEDTRYCVENKPSLYYDGGDPSTPS